MRLSEKGYIHLNELMIHELPFDAYEFKPEDFTGAVVLTVEEAGEILDYLSFLKWRHFNDEFLYGLADCNKRLYKRIEQAEGKK